MRSSKKGLGKKVAKATGNIVENAGKELVRMNEVKHRAKETAQWLNRIAIVGAPALDKLSARVNKRLESVPQNRRLQMPPATIAAPAMFQYALLGDSSEVAELREMFENLLVASMDKKTASAAHPAFVSTISQLTSDEARILKSIDRTVYAVIEIYVHDLGGRRQVDFKTLLGRDCIIDQTKMHQYLSNLDRLGIIRFSSEHANSTKEYAFLEAEASAQYTSRHHQFAAPSISTTALGEQFLNTCVRG